MVTTWLIKFIRQAVPSLHCESKITETSVQEHPPDVVQEMTVAKPSSLVSFISFCYALQQEHSLRSKAVQLAAPSWRSCGRNKDTRVRAVAARHRPTTARRRSPQAHNGICVSGIDALASRPPVLWGPALAIPRRRSSPLPLCGWGWSQTLPGPAGGRKLSHSWKYNARLGVQKPAGGNAKWEDRQCTTENVGSLVTPHGANIIWPNSMYHVWSDLSLDQLLRLIN